MDGLHHSVPATVDDRPHRSRLLLVAAVAVGAATTAGVLFAVMRGGSTAEQMTLPVATPADTPAPRLAPIEAVFLPAQQQTVYTVAVRSSSDVTYTWHLTPPPAEPGCNDFAPVPGTPGTAVWRHGGAGCRGVPLGKAGHLGTVTVTVANAAWECTASFTGTRAAAGPPPAPCLRR